MKIDSDFLSKLIEENGIIEALESIDINLIENVPVKTIARTLMFSVERLLEELDEASDNDTLHVHEHDAT